MNWGICIIYMTYEFRLFFFFLLLESFNLLRPLLMIALYHQTKTSISYTTIRDFTSWANWNPQFRLNYIILNTHFCHYFSMWDFTHMCTPNVSNFHVSSIISHSTMQLENLAYILLRIAFNISFLLIIQ